MPTQHGRRRTNVAGHGLRASRHARARVDALTMPVAVSAQRMFLASAVTTVLVLSTGCSKPKQAELQDANAQGAAALAVGCAKDTDCKGDRICDRGLCAEPRPNASAGPVLQGPQSATSTSEGLRRVASESSKYGRFEMLVDTQDRTSANATNPSCRVSFRHASGRTTPLFVAPDCIGDVVGMNLIGAADRVGGLALPALGSGGEEFHLFEVASARGGNAVVATDYWAVVVRPEDAWATSRPFASGGLTNGKIAQSALVADEPPTTTAAGARYAVTFGSVSKSPLAILPSSVVSKGNRVLIGRIGGGSHADGFRRTIETGTGPQSTTMIIDDNGPCPLDSFTNEGSPVRMTAEVTKWSDGRTVVKCISIQ